MMIAQSKKDEVKCAHTIDVCFFGQQRAGVQQFRQGGPVCMEAAVEGNAPNLWFGWRDKFMPDCKFCNDKICEQIVAK